MAKVALKNKYSPIPGLRLSVWRDYLVLGLGWLVACLLITLSSWAVEKTWIQPSMTPPPEGAAGSTQWGGMLPELRHPPRVFMDNDPYYWIAYAREMVSAGKFRIRYTDLDNVPYGREMHWDSGSVWWLVCCGVVTSWVTGEPMAQAIETGSLFSNPVLFALTLAIAGYAVTRRFGGGLAAGFIILLATLPALSWDYGYARPGHHGVHASAALGMMLGLLLGGAGWVRTRPSARAEAHRLASWPTPRAAKVCFIVAGFCGAWELWVGATEQMFVLAAAGAGLVCALLVSQPEYPELGLSLQPGLYRLWGRVACLAALAFYAVEYFPDALAFRLEVNHPVYAFAFLGGGEILYHLARWRVTGRLPQGRDRLWFALGLAAIVIAPLALAFGPDQWHAWHNPYMRRQHDFIDMFEPVSRILQSNAGLVLLVRFGVLPLGVLGGALLVWWSKRMAPWRAGVCVSALAAIVIGVMMIVQVRWAGLFSLMLALTVLIVVAAVLDFSRLLSRFWRASLIALCAFFFVVPNLVMFGFGFANSLKRAKSGTIDPILAWTIASRDVAFNLKRIAAFRPVRVMSGPGQSPALHYFGGIRGTGSLYWENIDGVRDAAAFFSDSGEGRAREIVRQRGITYVVVQQSLQEAFESCAIYYGRADQKDVEASLAYRLADPIGKIPKWLEAVPYYGSPMASAFQMRLYRVLPEHL